MSNNKDMKVELHKLCDSFFQSEDEEKLLKELKDNLEKFFINMGRILILMMMQISF